MSGDDVNRLYQMLAELRDEVHGYRAELNGRLRDLEEAEARRGGATEIKENMYKLVFGVAGMAAAISAVMAFVLDRV